MDRGAAAHALGWLLRQVLWQSAPHNNAPTIPTPALLPTRTTPVVFLTHSALEAPSSTISAPDFLDADFYRGLHGLESFEIAVREIWRRFDMNIIFWITLIGFFFLLGFYLLTDFSRRDCETQDLYLLWRKSETKQTFEEWQETVKQERAQLEAERQILPEKASVASHRATQTEPEEQTLDEKTRAIELEKQLEAEKTSKTELRKQLEARVKELEEQQKRDKAAYEAKLLAKEDELQEQLKAEQARNEAQLKASRLGFEEQMKLKELAFEEEVSDSEVQMKSQQYVYDDQVEAAMAATEDLRTRYDRLLQHNEHLEAEALAAESNVKCVQEELEMAQNECATKTQDLRVVQGHMDVLETENDSLTKQVAAEKMAYDDHHKACEKARKNANARIEDLTEEVDLLREELAHKSEGKLHDVSIIAPIQQEPKTSSMAQSLFEAKENADEDVTPSSAPAPAKSTTRIKMPNVKPVVPLMPIDGVSRKTNATPSPAPTASTPTPPQVVPVPHAAPTSQAAQEVEQTTEMFKGKGKGLQASRWAGPAVEPQEPNPIPIRDEQPQASIWAGPAVGPHEPSPETIKGKGKGKDMSASMCAGPVVEPQEPNPNPGTNKGKGKNMQASMWAVPAAEPQKHNPFPPRDEQLPPQVSTRAGPAARPQEPYPETSGMRASRWAGPAETQEPNPSPPQGEQPPPTSGTRPESHTPNWVEPPPVVLPHAPKALPPKPRDFDNKICYYTKHDANGKRHPCEMGRYCQGSPGEYHTDGSYSFDFSKDGTFFGGMPDPWNADGTLHQQPYSHTSAKTDDHRRRLLSYKWHVCRWCIKIYDPNPRCEQPWMRVPSDRSSCRGC